MLELHQLHHHAAAVAHWCNSRRMHYKYWMLFEAIYIVPVVTVCVCFCVYIWRVVCITCWLHFYVGDIALWHLKDRFN